MGDPRGIGPEVVRKALRQPIDADVRIVGGSEDGAPSDVEAGRVAAQGIETAARLALCALNPHAGEGGLFGDEDDRLLKPAAKALDAAGPLPADTVFVRALRGEFDAVLAPYHDVGMTAVKVSGFGTGVNVTLGLPFIRTSPDHGTAFDIAGKGIADAGSMRASLELAVQLAAARRAKARA